MRVLIVDDDEASRYLISTILVSAGHEVDTAVDGIEALAKARSRPPGVLVSDILMPRMDGYQLVREWKADATLSAIPVIFCTASYTDPADEKFALALGVDGFLSKPVDPGALLDTLASVLAYEQRLAPRAPTFADETEVLQEYNERLVHKLEKKVVDLERTNAMLERAMVALNEDMEVKKRLVDGLGVEIEERKRREEDLKRERDFSRRLVDAADVFIVGLDRDLRITLFSPGAARKSGYSPDSVMGTSFIDLFVPDEERAFATQYIRSTQAGETPLGRVGPIRTARGEKRVYEWTATISSDIAEAAEGLLLFGIDVTERVVAASVDRAMARIDLAVLLDRPRSEILDVACERIVSEFNCDVAFVVLPGTHRGEELEIQSVAGPLAGVLSVGADAGASLEICPVAEAMAHDTVVIVTAGELGNHPIAQQFDGCELAAFPLRAHGVTMGAIGIVSSQPHAFTAYRKDALRRLADRVAVGLLVVEGREQVALQLAALESAGNAIVIATAEGRVSWVNPAFCELTGYLVHEAIHADLFSEENQGYREPQYAEAWKLVLEGRTWSGEVTNQRKNGTSYLEDVTIAGVLDDVGDVEHVVIVKQDVSERRELEQLKADFVAVVSHELRTPLTSVIGYADLLHASGQKAQLPDTMLAAIEKLQLNAGRMQQLIEQLLEVTQVRAELPVLDVTDVDVAGLLEAAVRGVERTPSHEVMFDIEAETTVTGDPRRLQRVFELLIDNAVKYSPDGGAIRISARHDGDFMAISIADEGIGMPAEKVPGLFDQFTQLDMSSTRRFGGMGLGLFLAYSVVRAHGGTLSATSVEGEGSTFTVRLPLRDCDTAPS